MNKSQALESQKQNEEIVQLNDKLAASLSNKETLKSNMLLKEEMIVHLNGRVSEKQKDSSQSEEMTDIVEALQTQLSALEQASHTEHELTDRCSKLEEDLSKVCKEKEQLKTEVTDLRDKLALPGIAASDDTLEARFKEQEKTIEDLRALLAAKESFPSVYKVPFDQEFLSNPLGATLTRARKTLVEKLQEKEAIEKELGLRRAELKCQMSDK